MEQRMEPPERRTILRQRKTPSLFSALPTGGGGLRTCPVPCWLRRDAGLGTTGRPIHFTASSSRAWTNPACQRCYECSLCLSIDSH